MTPESITTHQVEMWKKIVDVQQHFNDIEIRIRNLMITILGALFGAAGFLVKEQVKLVLSGTEIGLEKLLLVLVMLMIVAFWFMDRFWYHRLLIGAVEQGLVLEDLIGKEVPGGDLAKRIGDRSSFYLLNKRIRSTNKIDVFYGIFFIPSTIAFIYSVNASWLPYTFVAIGYFLVFWFFLLLEDKPI